MTLKQYNWKDGPDLIQQHSVAKHRILQAYLAAYFRTLVSSPNQDVLRLTLVDGFAGGGLYVHNDTRETVKGSPFIFLEATREAEFVINKDRRKPVQLQVDYFFTEADHHAHLHLNKVLREAGYGDRIGNGIYLEHARFQDKADAIIAFIKKKSPKNGRSIFALDQYGYKEVPTQLLRKIFDALPSAEVILTFGVDSFMNFANDGDQMKDLLDGLGIPDIFGGRSVDEIKSSDRDWRLFLQSTLYRRLVENCGARHFTPFFIHYGGAGLDMFQMVGYDPVHDASYLQQSPLGFEFDDVARRASIAALSEHIPRRVYADDTGISFGELFATTCNSSPASAQIYRDSIGQLLAEQIIEVVPADGGRRRSAAQIKATDQIIASNQRTLFAAI